MWVLNSCLVNYRLDVEIGFYKVGKWNGIFVGKWWMGGVGDWYEVGFYLGI